MVKIRLTRTGRKKLTSFRVIAVDSRKPRETKSLEQLGHYHPHTKELVLKADRIKYWLSVGAQPTDTVLRLLVKDGILPRKDLPKKKFNMKPGRKKQERAAQGEAVEVSAEKKLEEASK